MQNEKNLPHGTRNSLGRVAATLALGVITKLLLPHLTTYRVWGSANLLMTKYLGSKAYFMFNFYSKGCIASSSPRLFKITFPDSFRLKICTLDYYVFLSLHCGGILAAHMTVVRSHSDCNSIFRGYNSPHTAFRVTGWSPV